MSLQRPIAPRELLGLTATPERADGQDVREVFFDGHAATELRLWDALEEDLLTSFHYFVVGDTVDLTSAADNAHAASTVPPSGHEERFIARDAFL